MRRGRWLILAAIVLIVVFVGATYSSRKETLAKEAPAAPERLGTGLEGRANDWVYTQSDGNQPRVTVRAKSTRQLKAPSLMELDGVELQLFHKDGTQYDLVRSAKAQFDIPGKTLYADGEVEISLAHPVDEPERGRILKIHSSGVHFASDTGKATTDRGATFEFDEGGGSATGAEYDPQTHQLHLLSNVKLDWTGKSKDTVPMHVEAGEAVYLESDAIVNLRGGAKLRRGNLEMEAASSDLKINKGAIEQAVSESARGVQTDPDRRVDFSADRLTMQFAEGTVIRAIQGDRNGKLISTATTMRTTVTGDQLHLDFEVNGKESTLGSAVSTGKSVAEAVPIPVPGELPADTRILRSDVIHLKMHSGGKEIESVETDGPGTVDFLPNRPAQPKRFLKGDRIWIAYGSDNRIQTFRSVNATTRTDKPGTPAPPALLTSSKELLATFDPKTSELARLEQKTDFKYEEGDRRATGDHANLDQARDVMTIEGVARVWDSTGSASADRIIMNQKSGDFTAEGHVATTRMPDQKGSSTSGMLSTSQVMQGRSQHMTSAERNQKLHYEGNAVVWQGANRVEGDRIEIDRAQHTFEAHGKVVSQFVDKAKDDAKDGNAKDGKAKDDSPSGKAGRREDSQKKSAKNADGAAPIFTMVRAPDLVYDDQTRVANYLGGAALSRPGLSVAGKQIRAYLKDADADSSLEKAFADGTVKIVSTTPIRTRTGTSEHAEYYPDEQKVLLTDGEPLLIDSVKGQTRGKQLTWFANNDRLLVNGVEARPADSLLRKK